MDLSLAVADGLGGLHFLGLAKKGRPGPYYFAIVLAVSLGYGSGTGEGKISGRDTPAGRTTRAPWGYP